jgi:hypothetical protein
VKLAPAETDDDKGKSLDEAIADYLEDVRLTKKRKTVLAYATALEYGVQNIVGKNDWPKYVEEQSEIYEKEEIDRLFAACNDQERLYFQFFLMTGMREQDGHLL